MTKREEKKQADELSPEELEEQNGEELPDREAMSVLQVPTIAPEPGLGPWPPLPEGSE
jgi:hypothetical protein